MRKKLNLVQSAAAHIHYFDWDGDIATFDVDGEEHAIVFHLSYSTDDDKWIATLRDTDSDWTQDLGEIPDLEAKRMVASSEYRRAKDYKLMVKGCPEGEKWQLKVCQ